MTGAAEPQNPSGPEPVATPFAEDRAAASPLPPSPTAGSLSRGSAPIHPATGHEAPVPPPPREAWRPPRRVEPVPGTPFAVVHLDVPPVTSGLSVGSLTAGVGSVVVALAVACFGLLGARDGWGAWAGGAFVVLAGLLGVAGIVLGLLGQRQIRRVAPPPAVRFTGRGLAIAGMSCGGAGLVVTAGAFALALLLQLT